MKTLRCPAADLWHQVITADEPLVCVLSYVCSKTVVTYSKWNLNIHKERVAVSISHEINGERKTSITAPLVKTSHARRDILSYFILFH